MIVPQIAGIDIDISGLSFFEQANFVQELRNVTEVSAIELVGYARQYAPVKDGNLQNAIQHQVKVESSYVEAIIGIINDGTEAAQAATDYAEYVEFGTAPHEIRARKAKALFWEGADHPVKSVNHPGTQPRPFMRPAADIVFPRYTAAINQLVSFAGLE